MAGQTDARKPDAALRRRVSTDERIARERVEQACSLIRSAYRLHSLDPRETLSNVQTAIAWGAEEQAEDIREEAFRV